MTQKELLYFEDAISHEDIIIKLINDNLNNLKDENLISFMNEEKKYHEDLRSDLNDTLKEVANG